MDLEFTLILKDVDESYPPEMSPSEIAMYIAEKKALAFESESESSLVITADTIVAFQGQILGKPRDEDHAIEMLSQLSGQNHQVYTGVSLSYKGSLKTFSDKTEVFFQPLTNSQIRYYVEKYKPLDKAGAYGIQDWIGFIAVKEIVGSYTNVMGLPTEKLYTELCNTPIFKS